MHVFAFIFTGIYFFDIALHLFSIVKCRRTLRRITKVLLMPLLALCFYLIWSSFLFKSPPWLIVVALLFGCVGDLCLINHHHKVGFPLGIVAFSIGHILYIYQLLSLIAVPPWWMILLLAVLYTTGAAVTFKKLSPYLSKQFSAACLVYMLLLCILSAVAVTGMLTSFNPGSVILTIGTFLFLLSDTKLSFEIFKGASKNGNLQVMITYIAAQTFLVTGFFLWMAT